MPATALVSLADELPTNVTISAGPAALVCWSTNPMAIEEFGLTLGANSKPYCSAIFRGSPTCTNWMRGVWKLNSPLKLGEGTPTPLRLLLPCSHSGTAARLTIESLRKWNSMSLDSITTSTLKCSFVTFGMIAPGPPTRPSTTSVGMGMASTSTGRPGLAVVVGMLAATSDCGRRLK